MRQQWRTPPKLFETLHSIFNFTIDAAASQFNTLLPRYWSEYNNALNQDWASERVFCNPPFGNPADFLRKADTAKLAVVLLSTRAITSGYYVANAPQHLAIPSQRINYCHDTLIGGSPDFGTVLLLYRSTARQRQQLKQRLECVIYALTGVA